MSNTDLVSTAEVARLTGRDVATVARWAGSGKLTPAYKGEGRTSAYIFRRSDVDKLLKALLTENRLGPDATAWPSNKAEAPTT